MPHHCPSSSLPINAFPSPFNAFHHHLPPVHHPLALKHHQSGHLTHLQRLLASLYHPLIHLYQPFLLFRCPLTPQSPFHGFPSPFSNAPLFLTLFPHPHTPIQHTSTPPLPFSAFPSSFTFHGYPLTTPLQRLFALLYQTLMHLHHF